MVCRQNDDAAFYRIRNRVVSIDQIRFRIRGGRIANGRLVMSLMQTCSQIRVGNSESRMCNWASGEGQELIGNLDQC